MKKIVASFFSLAAFSLFASSAFAAQTTTFQCPPGWTCVPNVVKAAVSVPAITVSVVNVVAVPVATSTATTSSSTPHVMLPGLRGMVMSTGPVLFVVSGTGFGQASTTSFNVYVSNSTTYKNATLWTIKPGDMVFVQGTTTQGSSWGPTNIAASSINDHGQNYVWKLSSTSILASTTLVN